MNMLDLTLSPVDGFVQTDVLQSFQSSAQQFHPPPPPLYHCTKAVPYGVATRLKRNCSTIVNWAYNRISVNQQVEKGKPIPRKDFLKPKKKDYKIVVDSNTRKTNSMHICIKLIQTS